MKKSFQRHTFTVALLSFVASAVTGFGAATFSVSPSIISNDFTGKLTFTMTGLTAGEAITIEQFTDFNSNKVVDGADLRVNCYRIADGQVRTIGGITNLNQLSDANAASTAITTSVEFLAMTEAGRSIGAYVFRFTGNNSGTTNVGFTNVNAPYAERITGTNKSGSTNIANAFVAVLAPTSGDGGNFFTGVATDSSGVYSVKVPPGMYQLFSLKSNYVCDTGSAPFVNLLTNTISTNNINLIPATTTISGKLRDPLDTNANFPCVQMFVQSDSGLVTLAFTDTNGNFTTPVTSNTWKLQVSEKSLAALGYLSPQGSVHVDTSTGAVSGVTVNLTKGRSMIYGFVRDAASNALVGVPFFGGDNSNLFESSGLSGANGAYSIAASPDMWYVNVDNSSSFASRYIFSSTNLTVPDLTAVRLDFSALPITGQISGTVRGTNGVGISGIDVFANADIGGQNYNVSATTDGSGAYVLPAGDGVWYVFLDCYDLALAGFDCSTNAIVTVPPSNHVVNFTALPLQPLAVVTTNLSDGTAGSFYFEPLSATGGSGQYHWTNIGGSLPDGLSLDPFGYIQGTPTTPGSNSFTVQVTADIGGSASRTLSIRILSPGPPTVLTTSLPGGSQGCAYTNSLQATGGVPPYTWTYALGSALLPPNLILGSNGTVTGVPATNGPFSFFAQVMDSLGASNSGMVSLFINSAVQITTSTLPNGTVGTNYSAQVFASGGSLPRTWTIVTNSLPPNLVIGTNDGTITGTPTTAGTYTFTVRATDTCGHADQVLSITIYDALQVATTTLPPAFVGVAYSTQLLSSGGQPSYSWMLASGSMALPPGFMLSSSGLLTGMAGSTGTNAFIVQVNDGGGRTATRSLSLIAELRPTLDLAHGSSNVFQFRVNGTGGQGYIIQANTNLGSTNWVDLFTTNSPGGVFLFIDSGATTTNRFYRVKVN